ncbi:MAG: TRAP transporter substrate-binding protein [Geodermatophilaceae bacterium]
MKRTGLSAMAITVAVALGVSACSAASGSSGSKAGGDPAPVTLRIGTDDEPGRPAADAIEEFARRVQGISDGKLLIEPVWRAAGRNVDDWDQAVARLVVTGDLDMGMIPARAWDTEGVTSLRALNAPFLVTSEALVEQVVTTDVATEMLAGLDQAGVTGLALVPEALREIFSFGQPLRSPADFQGATIRAPRSDTTYAMFEALGATVDDFTGDLFDQGVSAGTITAAESSFGLAGSLPRPPTATGNLIPFPKVNSLVINADVFAALDSGQQQMLRDAAAATRDQGVEAMTSAADAAAAFCKNGGTVVTATDDELAAFRSATEPVYAELEEDAQTKALIKQIRDLGSDLQDPAPVLACQPTAASSTPVPPGGTFPEGIYRAEMSADVLVAAGVDGAAAAAFDGINDLTFDNGTWLHDLHDGPADTCGGAYSVEGDQLVVSISACGSTGVLFSAEWTFDGTSLTFEQLSSETDSQGMIDATWGGQPWEKIG